VGRRTERNVCPNREFLLERSRNMGCPERKDILLMYGCHEERVVESTYESTAVTMSYSPDRTPSSSRWDKSCIMITATEAFCGLDVAFAKRKPAGAPGVARPIFAIPLCGKGNRRRTTMLFRSSQ